MSRLRDRAKFGGDWVLHLFLLLYLAQYVVSPLLVYDRHGLDFQRHFNAVMMVSTLWIMSRRGRDLVIGFSLLIPAIVCDVLSDRLDGAQHIAGSSFSILYLGFVAALLLRRIFSANRVTLGTISTALCLYVLLAWIFGLGYDLIDTIEGGHSFDGITPAQDIAHDDLEGRQIRSMNLSYFSMVTMTTLGYGDIVPLSQMTRGIAAVQAFMGQMFLAILIARLVGIYSRTPRAELIAEDQEEIK